MPQRMIIAFLCIAAFPGAPRAQTENTAEEVLDESPSESRKTATSEPARRAFEAGKTLYKEQKFAEAAKQFKEAYVLRPSWKLLFNIGQSLAASKQNGLALDAFEQYLSLGGDEISEERHALVLKEIARLRPIVGFVAVDAAPKATVYIDDVKRGQTPLMGPLPVSAGVPHTVRIEVDGSDAFERGVKVSGGQTISVSMNESGPAASPETPPSENAPPQPGPAGGDDGTDTGDGDGASPLFKAGMGLIGTGAALLIAGTITGGVAMSRSNELDTACPNQICDDHTHDDLIDDVRALSISTDVLLPTGGVVAVAGIILTVLGKKNGSESRDGALSVRPVIARDHGGLVLKGAF